MDRTISPRVIRRIVGIVFFLGVAGIIVGSIKDSPGLAITSGLVSAAAALGLILVTSVVPPAALAKPVRRDPGAHERDASSGSGSAPPVDETVAADVERRIADLVRAGADEEEVRRLVRRAMDLHRA